MNADEKDCVLRHTAHCAKHYIAYRGSLEKLVELVRYSIGHAAPAADAVANFLRREDTQKELETTYETALWVSSDYTKSWRLICLATTADPAVAARLLDRKAPPDACAFCWQQERGWTDKTLVREQDVSGAFVGNTLLHPTCVRPWKRLRDLVARSGVPTV